MVDINEDGRSAKVVSPIKLAHVVLRTQVETYPKMVKFYETFLGGQVSYGNDFLSFITYDDEHHRVAIAAIPGIGPKDVKTSGLEHIAFAFDSIHDLLAAYSQRKELGIEPVWCVNHGITFSIYYKDPDGNQLETQVDAVDSADEATAFMQSEAFAENPIGVDFDPEEVIRKLEGGESAESFLERPNIGPRDLTSTPLIV